MKDISIIGVQCDFGQQRRGVDMGPSAIRYAGLQHRLEALQYRVHDQGNIQLAQATKASTGASNLLNIDEVVAMNEKLSDAVQHAVQAQYTPLVIGGDHSIAIGTMAGLSRTYKRMGVIWFDAHADLNTPETTPSGNIHGMPLAVGLGLGDTRLTSLFTQPIQKEHVILIGARSVDEGERVLIQQLGIKVYTMHEIDRLGMAHVMTEAIDYLQQQQLDAVHLSVDLDALDPLYTPGVGTPVSGGITYRESHLAMEMLHESQLIRSVEFVEVNPILDERNKTANVAVALAGSLFGETLV